MQVTSTDVSNIKSTTKAITKKMSYFLNDVFGKVGRGALHLLVVPTLDIDIDVRSNNTICSADGSWCRDQWQDPQGAGRLRVRGGYGDTQI